MTIPGEIVQDYGGVRIAEPDVVGFYQEWLAGDLPDTTFGSPTLNMRDGDRIVVGGRPFGPPDPLEQGFFGKRFLKVLATTADLERYSARPKSPLVAGLYKASAI